MERMVILDHKVFKDCLDQWELQERRDQWENLDVKEILV